MANSYQESVDRAKKDIAEIDSQLESLHNKILTNAESFRKMLAMSGGTNLKQMNELLEKLSKLEKENIELKEKKNAANKKSAESEEKLKRAYDRLIKQQKKAKKSLQDVNLEFGKNDDRTLKAKNLYNDLSKKIKDANTTLEQQKNQITKSSKARLAELDRIERNKQALLKHKKTTIESSRSYQDLIKQQKEAKKSLQDLNLEFGKNSKKTLDAKNLYNELTQKIKDANTTTIEQVKATSTASGAYKQLKERQKKAKETLQDLAVTQGKNSYQTRKARREYKRLSKEVEKVDRLTARFSKNSLPNVFRGFKKLLAVLGVTGVISLVVKLGKNIFKLAKDFDSLEFSMRKVIKTEEDLATTQVFLLRLTTDYGVALLDTSKRYLKFLAAAQQANLSLYDTEKIFGSVTKVSAILALKTDELTSVYLALEQMLSKGVVSTEELRRQLGERMPGAFGIMAAALDVPVSKLNDMLRNSEILSAEALPKFARALELAYGTDKIKKVNNLQAAQNRLSNTWKFFIQDITKADGSLNKFFKGAINSTNSFVKLITRQFSSEQTLFRQEVLKQEDIFQKEFNKKAEERLKKEGVIIKDYTKDALNIRSKIVRAKNQEEKDLYNQQLSDINRLQISQDNKIREARKKIAAEEIEGAIKSYDFTKSLYEKDQNNLEKQVENKEKTRRGELDFNTKMFARRTAEFDILRKELQESNVQAEESGKNENKRFRLRTQRLIKEKDTIVEMLKIRKELSKRILEDDDVTFKERTNMLVEFSEINKLIAEEELKLQIKNSKLTSENIIKNIEIRKIEREKELKSILADSKYSKDAKKEASDNEKKLLEIDSQNRKTARKNEQAEIDLAYAKYFSTLEKNLEEEKKIRTSIQNDILNDIKENLKSIEEAEKVSKNRKIIEAHGNKKEIEEIENNHTKALLEIQSSYLSKVLKNNADLTEEQVRIIDAMLSEIGVKISQAIDKSNEKLKETQDLLKEIFQTSTNSFSDAFDIDTSKFNFIFDELAKNFDGLKNTTSELFNKDKIGEWADASKESISGVLNASTQRFEIEIENARIARDTILNDELETEEKKNAAKRKYEQEERRIKTERAKKERDNILIQIAVDTAAAAVKAYASQLIPGDPTSLFRGIKAAGLVISFGALQAAFVSSQKLPKFFSGVENAPEGFAYTDEKGAELHTDNRGNIKDFGSSKGARIKYLKQGDKIYTAEKTKQILHNFSIDKIRTDVLKLNMLNDSNILNKNTEDFNFSRLIRLLESSNNRMSKEIKKLSERPIKVINDVNLQDNSYY